MVEPTSVSATWGLLLLSPPTQVLLRWPTPDANEFGLKVHLKGRFGLCVHIEKFSTLAQTGQVDFCLSISHCRFE